MQVSVETTQGLERRMTVEVPQERIDAEVENRLAQLARTTRLKGFRPGKVPLKVVRQQYGDQVRQEVLGEVMQSSYYEAVTQENLRPAGNPQIEPGNMDPGKNLEFVATFEVMPEFEPAALKGQKLEKVTAEVSDADVDKVIESLRKQRADWNEVDRAAAEGDRVTIDFTGSVDGEEFEGGKGNDVQVTLGSGQMIPGFEDGITGAKPGEERTIDVTFPEDYGHEPLAGKAAQFAIKVNKVEEPKLPEVDEEFVKGFGVEGGVEGLRAEVRRNMERELQQHLSGINKQQVMDKLLEVNEVVVPRSLIENESRALADQMRQQMHTPAGKQPVDLDLTMFEEQATRRVTLGLILAEVIKRNEIKVTPEQLKERVEQLAAAYEKPDEVVRWYYSDRNRLGEVESLALEDQVVEWAWKSADVTEVKKGFDDIMNPGKTGA